MQDDGVEHAEPGTTASSRVSVPIRPTRVRMNGSLALTLTG